MLYSTLFYKKVCILKILIFILVYLLDLLKERVDSLIKYIFTGVIFIKKISKLLKLLYYNKKQKIFIRKFA